MAIRSTIDGKIVTSGGKPSCTCCGVCMRFNDTGLGAKAVVLLGSIQAGHFSGIYDAGGFDYSVELTWNAGLAVWEVVYQSIPLVEDLPTTAVYTNETDAQNPVGLTLDYDDGVISVDAEVLSFGTCGCNITWDTSVFAGQIAGNPWVVSNNGSRIRFNIEDSTNCGGPNNDVQSGVAAATITAGAVDTLLGFSFAGLAEEQASGFENISFYLNAVLVASATSPGSIGGGTCLMGPAVVTYHVPPPYLLTALSVNTLSIEMDTGDAAFHVGAYYQADFTCIPA